MADGIDAAGLETWFAAHVPEAAPPLAYERIAGGRSNLTYCVTDRARRRWILRRPPLGERPAPAPPLGPRRPWSPRRPPLGERLASAHDMGREHRILAGLAGTPVPVPAVVGLCTDEG